MLRFTVSTCKLVARMRPPDVVAAAAPCATAANSGKEDNDFLLLSSTMPAESAPARREPQHQQQGLPPACSAAIRVLAHLPRDGALVKTVLGRACAVGRMDLGEVLRGLEYLRRECDFVVFHRGGQRAHERISFRTSASQDHERLSLQSVQNFFASVARARPEGKAAARDSAAVATVNPSSSSCAAAADAAETEGAESPQVVQELIAQLQRDVKQERDARAAAERRAAEAQAQVIDVLRLVANSTIVVRRGKQIGYRRKRRKTRAVDAVAL